MTTTSMLSVIAGAGRIGMGQNLAAAAGLTVTGHPQDGWIAATDLTPYKQIVSAQAIQDNIDSAMSSGEALPLRYIIAEQAAAAAADKILLPTGAGALDISNATDSETNSRKDKQAKSENAAASQPNQESQDREPQIAAPVTQPVFHSQFQKYQGQPQIRSPLERLFDDGLNQKSAQNLNNIRFSLAFNYQIAADSLKEVEANRVKVENLRTQLEHQEST